MNIIISQKRENMNKKLAGSLSFKKALRCLIASAFFFVFEAALAFSLISEYYFIRAKESEKRFLWNDAQVFYSKAKSFGPIDAKYPAALADFLLRRRKYNESETDVSRKAEALYSKASKLAPYSAEYLLALGQLQLHLFLSDSRTFRDKLPQGLKNMEKALASDPEGINTSYLFGYAYVSVWGFLNSEQKEAALGRLRYALSYRPWYANFIYPALWRAQKDFVLLEQVTPKTIKLEKKLYAFILEHKLLEGIRLECENQAGVVSGVINLSQWHGRSFEGNNVYKDGIMRWAGIMGGLLNVPEGYSSISISARGVAAGGVYPYMVVKLEEDVIGSVAVNNYAWKEYVFNIHTTGGRKLLSIIYVNDRVSKDTGEDMDLYIGEARVEKR